MILFPNNLMAKEIPVPLTVQKSFSKRYPKEKNPKWNVDAHGSFEAVFKENGKKYRADFSPDGEWIETECSIGKKDLPKAVLKVIDKKYADRKITEVELVENAVKGTFYDVEFKQKGKNMDVEFRTTGEIIN